MNEKVRIAGVIKESIVDGPGIRFVVFAQGCPHHCDGCHNPATHDFNKGNLIEIETIINEMKRNPLLDGITLSGGEPFEQPEAFGELARRSKALGYHVMTYTGYTYETLMEKKDEQRLRLLENTDLLVDGKFEAEQKSLMLKFRGSKNQRIIDLNKSRRENRLTLSEIS
ncbi:MAG: anaerobic ribonucleoside-triphosphate reductase activating protein [Acetobacterium sp.]|nr:anaerobic ribonucleoside-triphosphate reductase activating protein [Bacillota bacterium]MCG2730206.1 anaerobic ribonucleoside-triphosphate reductase activating protein [Acetobacterium sp.]